MYSTQGSGEIFAQKFTLKFFSLATSIARHPFSSSLCRHPFVIIPLSSSLCRHPFVVIPLSSSFAVIHIRVIRASSIHQICTHNHTRMCVLIHLSVSHPLHTHRDDYTHRDDTYRPITPACHRFRQAITRRMTT